MPMDCREESVYLPVCKWGRINIQQSRVRGGGEGAGGVVMSALGVFSYTEFISPSSFFR